jgi:hypothetical protein
MQRNSMRDPVPFGLANNDLNYHFTIISCLYHLQTIDAVHLVSPRRSTLTPLIEFGASYEVADWLNLCLLYADCMYHDGGHSLNPHHTPT